MTIPDVGKEDANFVDNVDPNTGEVTRVPYDEKIEGLVSPNGEYADGAMAAALNKAGITPETSSTQAESDIVSPQPTLKAEDIETTPVQPTTTPITEQPKETPRVLTRERGGNVIDKELQRASTVEDVYRRSQERLDSRTQRNIPKTTREIDLTPKGLVETARAGVERVNKIVREHDKDIKKAEETYKAQQQATPKQKQSNTKQPPSQQPTVEKSSSEKNKQAEPSLGRQLKDTQVELKQSRDDINNPNKSEQERVEALKKSFALEKKEAKLQAEIDRVILGHTPIPKPMKEVMDEVFDKEYRIKDKNVAFEYARKEEQYYEDAKRRRSDDLRKRNLSEEQIKTQIRHESAIIRERIQAHLKRKITLDIKELTLQRIKENRGKYPDLTDEDIQAIEKGNLTGRILAERVYSKWQSEYIKEPEPIDPTPEVKKEPWYIRHLAIIGGVAGFGTAIAFGATVGTYGAIIGGAVAGISLGTSKLSEWRMGKLAEKLNNAQTEEERAKLEKKLRIWGNIKKHADRAMKFFGGFGFGSGLGVTVSNLFMGGKGLVQIIQARHTTGIPSAEPTTPSPESPTGSEAGTSTGNEPITPQQPTGEISPREVLGSSPESISEGVLIQNGRVNLPGSAWHTNLATPPVRGVANMPTNFTGGATNMGAWNLEQNLINSGISRGNLMSNLTTPQIHSLLNTYQANPGTNLVTALENLGTDGAKNLIQIITGN